VTLLDSWNSMTLTSAFTHIWQSTVFVVCVWTLTLAMRDRAARVRFLLWMAASIKFLVPFSLLAALGSCWPHTDLRPLADARFYAVVQQLGQPFAAIPFETPDRSMTAHGLADWRTISILLLGMWLIGSFLMLARLARQWWVANSLVKEAAPLEHGREVDAWDRTRVKARIRRPISIVGISKGVEPGIFGVRRPVLMWPLGLSKILSDAQIIAIMAHECEHVRRLDNLIALIQDLVEVVFWFNPMVWLISKKMIDERERACDERVLEGTVEPRTYADSILKVCAFCLEPPLPCVAGVSGFDLKKRVLRITTHRSIKPLSLGPRVGLIIAAISSIALPIGFGVVSGQSVPEQTKTRTFDKPSPSLKFDVVSIKPAPPSSDKTLFKYSGDETSFDGAPVRMVIETAFGVDDNHILGAPTWVNTTRYDIEAKVALDDAPRLQKMKGEDRRAMLIPMLAERFHLKYHHEFRERPVYALVVARGGPKLAKGESDPPPGWKPPSDVPPEKEHHKVMTVPGRIEADSIPMFVLADQLTRLHTLGRTVVDRTGLQGNYNFTLHWTPDALPFPLMKEEGFGAATDSGDGTDAASSPLFTAIQEQLGLKLVPEKSNDDVIVIDHIDPPTPN